jgi:hypothetical protein
MKKACLLIAVALVSALVTVLVLAIYDQPTDDPNKIGLTIKNESSQNLLMIKGAYAGNLLKAASSTKENGENAAVYIDSYVDSRAFLIERGKSYILTANGDIIPKPDITLLDRH